MKSAKLLRRHANWTLGLVTVLVITSAVTAWAGPVRMLVEVCTTDVETQAAVCSDPLAKCLPPVIARHCVYVEMWVSCRVPEACAELNRQLLCGKSRQWQACAEWSGLEHSYWDVPIDQSTQR